jgi:Tfp pilus assembly protein PilN
VYRINLYPEYVERRRVVRQRVGRTALVTVVVALELVLVVALVITGLLLREQAEGLRSDVASLRQQMNRASVQRPEMDVALQMLEIRQGRIDWSPKLASLSQQINRSLRLMELTGQTQAKGRDQILEIAGMIRGGGSDMQPVSVFIDSLRADPRISADFPFVRLGNVGGDGSTRFQVLCGKSKEAS